MNFKYLAFLMTSLLFYPVVVYSSYHQEQLSLENAWSITRGSPEIKIAVISSGVNYRLPELSHAIAINPGESGDGKESDGIDNDNNGYVDDVYGVNTRLKSGDPMDLHGVGTYEASLIASRSFGVAPNIKIIPVSVVDEQGKASWQNMIDAINYAKSRGAHVIYIGLQGGGASPSLRREICNILGRVEAPIVASAGNEAIDLDASHPWLFPVDCNTANLISVASSTLDSTLAAFSSYGFSKVHLAAPSDGVFGLDRYGRETQYLGGVVSASLTAGVAGLVLSEFPQLHAHEVKETLMVGSDFIPNLADKIMSGGRLNAFGALKEASVLFKLTKSLR